MKNRHTAGIVLLALVFTAHAGNKKLMTDAETELRELNKAVLLKVPSEKIPETGRIKVTADIKNTKPDPTITNIIVQTISTNITIKSKTD